MQHSNFQKKTSTKQLTHIPHLHPCNQNPSSATSPKSHAQSHTDTVLRTSHSWVLDNPPSLPGDADGLHKSFFTFLYLTGINIFQFFVLKEYFNL